MILPRRMSYLERVKLKDDVLGLDPLEQDSLHSMEETIGAIGRHSLYSCKLHLVDVECMLHLELGSTSGDKGHCVELQLPLQRDSHPKEEQSFEH